MTVKVAVVALQGDFEQHAIRLRELGAAAFPARTPAEINDADGIVIPGGESTTIGKLMARYGIDLAIRRADAAKKPIFGTCAGMILMAKSLTEESAERGGQPTLGLMDIKVDRNAYGRQIESFEAQLSHCNLHLDGRIVEHLDAVFIRAPAIESVGKDVGVLASYAGAPALVEQEHLLAASFHPELTADPSVHCYFLDKIAAQSRRGA